MSTKGCRCRCGFTGLRAKGSVNGCYIGDLPIPRSSFGSLQRLPWSFSGACSPRKPHGRLCFLLAIPISERNTAVHCSGEQHATQTMLRGDEEEGQGQMTLNILATRTLKEQHGNFATRGLSMAKATQKTVRLDHVWSGPAPRSFCFINSKKQHAPLQMFAWVCHFLWVPNICYYHVIFIFTF